MSDLRDARLWLGDKVIILKRERDHRHRYQWMEQDVQAVEEVLESEARLRELLTEWLEVASRYAPPTGPLADETRAALGETE